MLRIVRNLEAVQAADVVVCITGMDGGLASVVAGLVDIPVVALPTSAGYGTAFGGVTPLLAALNSAAPPWRPGACWSTPSAPATP